MDPTDSHTPVHAEDYDPLPGDPPGHTPGEIRLGQDVGYVGDPTDPTPNEHYTVPGVLAGKPTPETTAGRCRTPQPCIDADDQEP